MTFRSPKLLKLAQQAPHCMNPNCRASNFGQVVACHSGKIRHGKGTGTKAADVPAYLCNKCHDQLDGRAGKLGRFAKDELFFESAFETWLWLMENDYLEVKA